MEPPIIALGISDQVVALVKDLAKKTHTDEPKLADASFIDAVLKNESDLTNRINDILSQKPSTVDAEWLQLRDITYYLTIAESHIKNKTQAKELHDIIAKIQKLIQQTSEVVQPPWQGLLDAISKETHKTDEQPVASHLETHTRSTISLEVFAHIHAEQYIANTDLEGSQTSVVLEQMLKYLKHWPNPSDQMKEIISELEITQKLIEKIKLKMARSASEIAVAIKDFCENVIPAIANLELHKGIILPSGWVGRPSGHEMYFQLVRETNNSLRTIVYNSGAGINYHPRIVFQGQIRFQPFLEKNSIEEKNIANSDYLGALLEMNHVLYEDNNRSTEYNEQDPYTLLSLAEGNVVSPSDQFHHYIAPKAVGVCTWGALMAILLRNLPKTEYQNVDYFMRLKSLCDMYLHIEHKDYKTEESEMLLQKASEQFARDALVGYQEGIISLEELQKVETTLKIIFSHLESIRKSRNYQEDNSRQLNLQETAKLPKRSGISIELPEDLPMQSVERLQKDQITNPEPYTYTDFDGLTDPLTVADSLIKFRKWLSEQNDQFVIQTSAELFYEKIPLATLENNFWDLIPREQISLCMREISTITELSRLKEKKQNPNRAIGAVKCLAIVWDLARKCDNLKRFKSYHALPFSFIENEILGNEWRGRPKANRNSTSPILRDQLSIIIDYLRETSDDERTISDKLFPCSLTRSEAKMLFHYSFPATESKYSEERWIEQLADNPEIRSKLEADDPELAKASKAVRCGHLAMDLDGKYMDPDFCSLKKQTLNTLALLYSKSPGDPRIGKGRIIVDTNKNVDLTLLEDTLSRSSYSTIQSYDYEIYAEEHPILNEIVETMRKNHSPATQRYFTESVIKFIERYNHKIAESKDLPLELVKELCNLMSGGEYDGEDPHLEMQTIKVLAYFKQNLNLLTERMYQDFFKLLVFEGNFLEVLLTKNPSFIQHIDNFFSESLRFFADQGDYMTQAFLLEQTAFIEQIADIKRLSFTKRNAPETLKRWLSQTNLSQLERFILSIYLVSYFSKYKKNSLSPDELISLLQSFLFIGMKPDGVEKHNIPDLSELQTLGDETIRRHWKDISKILLSPSGQEILNTVCERLGIDVLDKRWDLTKLPLCTAGEITINLFEGTITSNKFRRTDLPVNVITHPLFKKIFKQPNYKANEIKSNTYEFTDENNRKVKIVIVPKLPWIAYSEDEIFIQYELKPGVWYSFLKEPPLAIMSAGGSQIIEENQTLWQSISNTGLTEFVFLDNDGHPFTNFLFEGVPRTEYVNELKKYLIDVVMQLKVRNNEKIALKYLLIHTSDQILQESRSLKNQKRTALSEHAQHPITLDHPDIQELFKAPNLSAEAQKLVELVKTAADKPPAKLLKVEKILPNGSKLELVDIYSTLNSLVVLESFTGKNGINLWRNQNGDLALMEIPRFDLSFTMEKKNDQWEAKSNDFIGYKLSSNQKTKGLDGFKEGIVLENVKGERKVLIPRLQVRPLKTGALSRSFEFVQKGSKSIYVAFDLDPKLGVVAKNREQHLLLAQVHLARKEYVQAHQELLKSYSKALEYTKEDQEILNWIFETSSLMRDGDPRSQVVSLLALILSVKNEPNQLSQDELKLKTIDEYLAIYRDPSQWSDIKFSAEDERLLLHQLSSIESLKNKDLIMKREYYLDNSLAYTEVMRASIQSNQVKKTQDIKPPLDKNEFVTWCQKLRTNASNQNPTHPLITRPGNELSREIQNGNFYEEIKNQSFRARIRLAFAKNNQALDPFLIDLLTVIAAFPERFPDKRAFVHCLENHEYGRFKTKFLEPYNQLTTLSVTSQNISASVTKRDVRKVAQTKETPDLVQVYQIEKLPPILTAAKIKDHFKEVPFVGIQLSDQEINELQKAVEVTGTPLAERKTQELQEDIAAAWSERKPTRPFIDPSKLDSIKTVLLVQKAEETKLLTSEMEKLLGAANKLPEERTESTVRRQATLDQEITFRDLCICLINKNTNTLKTKNSHLSTVEISQLLNDTLQILQRAKRVQKLERSLKDIEDMEPLKSLPDLEKNLDYLNLSEKLKENITTETAYDVEKIPEYSLFEFVSNIQLYKGQVDDLDLLIKGEGQNANLILQKIMGSGKSKVFLPILALKKADGIRLPVVVVPKAQYETTLSDMDASSGGIFEQVTHTFTFHRNSDCSTRGLWKMRTELEDMIAKKEYLLVTDVTMHCLHNKFKEMLMNYLNQNHQLPKDKRQPPPPELIEMRKIFGTLMTGILDEADLLLNTRHEVNFTSGKPEAISKKHSSVVREIFEFLYSSPELMAEIFPKEKKHVEEPSFTKGYWDTKLKPKAVAQFMDFEAKRKTLLGVYLASLSEKDKSLIYDYLLVGEKGDEFVAKMENTDLKNALAIVKEEFNELLPLTLNKPIGFKYGKSDNPNEILAVPYIGSTQPNPTSRFGNPYELLNYCAQLYLTEGISQPVLRALVENIKTRVLKEIANDPSLSAGKTLAYKDFEDLCGPESNMNLMRMAPADFERLEKRFQENKLFVFDFLTKHIFPHVQIYEGKIVSNHLDLVDLFDQTLGFSGTPNNKEMYHNRLKTRLEKGTDGKTLGILKKNSSKNIHAISKNTYTAILDELFRDIGPKSPARTFQDTAALFNGIPNELIAEEILKRVPHLEGVRYYDKQNKMQVMERRDKKFISVPVEKTRTTPENSFTYFSQPDTTGKDTKQIDQAVGFTTVGKTLTSRDLFQGVWRLRKLDKNQIAELVHIPEVADYIRQLLKLNPQTEISFDHIIKFTRMVEIADLDSQLPNTIMQKISHVLERSVERLAIDPKVDLMELTDAAPLIDRLFNRKQEDKPYEQFGQRERLEDSKKLVRDKIKEDLKFLAELQKVCPAFNRFDEIAMEARMEGTVPWNLLPKDMVSPVRSNRELTVEIEVQAQKEREINIQRLKEMQQQMDSSDADLEPNLHWNWAGSEADNTITAKSNFEPKTKADFDALDNQTIPGPQYLHRRPTITLSKGVPAVFTMQEILSNRLPAYKDIFDLEACYNFVPIKWKGRSNYQFDMPFYHRSIDVNNFLILVDRKTGQKRMILISNADAGYFNERLEQEKSKDPSQKELGIILGHVALSKYQSDDDQLAQEVLKSDDFVKFVTQAKFYNGELLYTKAEQDYLRKWIKEKGAERMEEFFYNEILRYKANQREAYPRSLLGHLINELRY